MSATATSEEQANWPHSLLDPNVRPPGDIKAWHGGDTVRRFNVYRNNILHSLTDALAATFPVAVQLVGDEFFRAMAAEYVRQHLPRTPILTRYGDTLADFLERFPPAASLPYLGDVARLEYARVQAWHAADAAPLTTSQMAAALDGQDSTGDVHLTLHPAVQCLPLRYAALSIWQAHHGKGRLADIDLNHAETVVLWRDGWRVAMAPIALAEARFLQALQAGYTLGEATGEGCTCDSTFDAGAALADNLRRGLFVGIEIIPTPVAPGATP